MATYTRKGHIHGRFDQGRFDEFDGVGRANSREFWEANGWEVAVNDRDENGKTVYSNTDLRATKGKKTVYVESAVKSPDLWKWIKGGSPDFGVDVETRKLKYTANGEAYVDMTNGKQNDERLVIPMDCLKAAQKSCGEEFKGHGRHTSSPGFVMPEHGCHRVRKYCRKGLNQTGEAEDFYRIPVEYVARYKKDSSGEWKCVQKPTKKIFVEMT
jgi:hypothetical protein